MPSYTPASARRAAEAVHYGRATKEQTEENNSWAKQSRFMNKQAQDAQDAQEGRLTFP